MTGTVVIMLLAAGTMLLLAVVAGQSLGWANKVFHVTVDPRIEQINAALPGANCGGCGFVGCMPYAEAVAGGHAPPDKCTVGGASVAGEVAKIMGVDLKPSWPFRPAVHCGATFEQRLGRVEYRGEQTCISANLVSGVQGCTYGCLGLGDCERACPFDAIHVIDGLSVVDYKKCTGCGKCAEVCPRNIISMVPFKTQRMLIIACSNKDPGKYVKAVCRVGCIGCRACERAAPDVFKVEENLSRINYDAYDPEKMDAARIAVQKCPMKRIVEIGKPSEKDVEAVKEKEVPSIVQADFKTTVDKTEWQG